MLQKCLYGHFSFPFAAFDGSSTRSGPTLPTPMASSVDPSQSSNGEPGSNLLTPEQLVKLVIGVLSEKRLDLILVHKFLVFIITWASCGKACYYMGFLQKSPYIAYRIQSFQKGTSVMFAQALITRLPMPSMDENGQFVAKSYVLSR